jgi:Zinc-binding dehydrogenase
MLRCVLTVVSELMEAGKVIPVIENYYELSVAPDTIRYLEEGHAREKVVIKLAY